jgi:hypothetical protein
MKKTYLSAALVAVVALLMYTNKAFTFQSGGFGESTGAPRKSGTFSPWATCAASGCHQGSPINEPTGGSEITSNIPYGNLVPGQEYEITFRVFHPNKDVFGFKAMVWGANDTASVGTLSKGDTITSIQVSPQRVNNIPVDTNYYITHAAGQAVPNAIVANPVGVKEWKAKWVAPQDVNQQIKVFATFVVANGNGKTSGDKVYYNTLDLATGLTTSSNNLEVSDLRVYPTLATTMVTLATDVSSDNTFTLTITALDGKIVDQQKVMPFAGKINRTIDVSSFAKGLYIINLEAQGISSSTKFIKQ